MAKTGLLTYPRSARMVVQCCWQWIFKREVEVSLRACAEVLSAKKSLGIYIARPWGLRATTWYDNLESRYAPFKV